MLQPSILFRRLVLAVLLLGGAAFAPQTARAAVAPTFVWRNPTLQIGSLNALTFASNRFLAAGTNGTIYTSTDGAIWHVAATLPNTDINEIAFGGDTWVAVTANGQILTSSDTFAWTSRPSTTTSPLHSVAYANNQFLVCGQNGIILTSPDGFAWTARSSGVTSPLRSISGRNGNYVVVGDANTLLLSSDTLSWRPVTLAEPLANLNTVAFLANQFVIIGNLGRIYSSPDGVTWTSRGTTTASGFTYSGVTHDGTQYIIGDYNGGLFYTTNLTNRTIVTPAFNRGINRTSLASGAGVTVVVGAGGEIATTTDARTWTQRGSDGVINLFQGAAYANNRWFALGTGWTLASSPDGAQWTRHPTQNVPAQGAFGYYSVAYGAGRYVAVGEFGFIATSTDGASWEGNPTASGTTQALNSVTFANGRFVAVADGGVIVTSTDGLAWTAATSGVTTNLNAVSSLDNTLVAVGANGVILTSTNGTAWTRATSGTTQGLNGLGVLGNTMYVVGGNRTILASTNGQTWTNRTVPTAPPNTGLVYNAVTTVNGGILVVGGTGLALFSSDGTTWNYLPALAARDALLGAASDGNRAIVVGVGGAILQSVDPAAPTSRLVNVATRGLVQPGGSLTPGFVLKGTGSKQVVVRAIGPTLSTFGLSAISDLKLDLINQQTNAAVANNDDWGGAAALANRFASLGAFALAANSRDAAVQATLPVNQGGYSVRITPSGTGTSGLALAEVYDGDGPDSTVRLGNVSTLGFAGTAENALTPGFVISGSQPKTLLIRAIGPGLTPLGVTGVLADPQLSVFPSGVNVAIAGNNDWAGTAALKAAFTSAGAFAVPDTSRDAAVVATLPPGGYTVVTSGADNTTGTLLVEVYDLDP